MKINWPAYRLAGLVLASLALIASPLCAQSAVPARAAEQPPAPALSSARLATTVAHVAVERSGQQTTVRVEGDGRLIYHVERLSSPARVVLDFVGVRMGSRHPAVPIGAEPVRRVRVSQFAPNTARVVIDLNREAPYSVLAEGKSVSVAFGAPRTANRPNVTAEISGLPLPEWLTGRAPVLASPKQQPAAAVPPPASAPASVPAPQSSAGAQAPAVPPGQKYTGEPISVNFKDLDIKDFFRLIHEISGLNVVLDPAVKGSLPALVLDDVPWDQALDIVLRNNSLDKQLEGNVLRIATRETLKKEAEIQRDLAKAQAEAVDPVTTTRQLSYVKAAVLRDTLKRFLSSRGEILADERSNTLIIRDIPSSLPQIDNLIRQLDRKAQQVEIEARVVAASRSFARDIGTQFAFATTTTSGRTVFGGNSAVGVSNIERGAGLPAPPLVVDTSLPLNTNLQAQSPTSGVSFAHASPNFALDFLITAAESKGVGKLLSKPKVITQNNEKAIVKQGTKIPIQTTINNTISIQYIDAVLKLEVTPQITAEGTIFMQVTVENTQIDAGIPRVLGIPALDTQAVEANVLISDGGTVVIGGVIISSQRTDVAQVPLFGSIPLIGHLFKRTTVNVQSQELLFFLTPRVLPT